MLLSTELEAPVVAPRDGSAATPEVFERVWRNLAKGSWSPRDFGVTRPWPGVAECISPAQSILTDTGPTLEIVTSPRPTLAGIQEQLDALLEEARLALDDQGFALLGTGVHPQLQADPGDYYRVRTPRAAYDYAIQERSWRHWSIVHVAATQEIVDVSFPDAPRAISMLHRLAGLMNFMLRNDPDLRAGQGGRLSVRPGAWRDHVPSSGPFAADAAKVGIPPREVESWRDYLSLLWDATPMFLVGTKDQGAAWVLQHPTFRRFVEEAPEEGWPARALSGTELRIRPEAEHIAQTDWTYMGFARIRWKWRKGPDDVAALLEAWRVDDIESFLASRLEKVVVENRCNATQPPGHALASLALVSGLLANLDEAIDLARRRSYAFWGSVLDASTTQPLHVAVDGHPVRPLAREMLDVALRGLRARGEDDPDAALSELYRRVDEGTSPSEDLLREHKNGDLARLVARTRL